MIQTPTHLRLRVDEDRLVNEVGQLFGSVSDALAEVVQNAYRAGARTLRVDVSGDTLTLADDGPGVEDPITLFSIGRSGWAEGIATDPAGMGAFALFALCAAVEVTSRTPSGAGWRATFEADAFQGAPIRLESVTDESAEPGLTIRAVLQPQVRLPDLKASRWRHRFPVDVFLTENGADPILVPPMLAAQGVRVETPVGVVVIASRSPSEPCDVAVWEHRHVHFPFDVRQRIAGHLRASIGGRIATDFLQDMRIEWSVDPSGSTVRPKLPDRAHLIENDALDRAVSEIAASLSARIDVPAACAALARAVAGQEIVPASTIEWLLAPEALGGLGARFRAAHSFPTLGFVRAHRARPAVSFDVDLSISYNDHLEEWTEAVESVWTRPRFWVESDAAETIALADGIPAVHHRGDRTSEQLPLLRIEADDLIAATSIGQLFGRGLRYVCDGATVAPVRHVYSHIMALEGAHMALAPRWQAAVDVLRAGPTRDGAHLETVSWLGLHPLPDGVRPIDYVRTSRAFARQAMRESAVEPGPIWFWDYANAAKNEVAIDDLVSDLALLFAEELGPETARLVAAEKRARYVAEQSARAANALRRLLHAAGACEADPGTTLIAGAARNLLLLIEGTAQAAE